MIGDGPADRLIDALDRLDGLRTASGQAKPSLGQVLGEVLAALQTRSDALLHEPIALQRLIAEFDDGTAIDSIRDEKKARSTAARILFDAFEDIAVEYEATEVMRKPKVTEVLDTLAFVLRNRLARYTCKAPTSRLKGIYASDPDRAS